MSEKTDWRWVKAVWDLGFAFVRLMDDDPQLKAAFEALDPQVREMARQAQEKAECSDD